MKNIYLTPTHKPSRLRYNLSGVLVLTKESYKDYSKSDNIHIYITSNEPIKEGWSYDRMMRTVNKIDNVYSSKIILTTDQDLIKDGVQAIDDEFLEWFVKNPSCERVEVQKWASLAECGYSYHIIIPQEPKPIHQQIIDIVGGEDRFKEIAGIKPKQETLEELGRFAERKYLERLNNYENCDFSNGVIEGAKWMQERMYSALYILRMYSDAIEFAEWIRIKDFQTATGNKWIGLNMEYYTTQGLYEQFKKDNL